MDSSTPPVLVIGNGPVGQTAALLLARWDIPVVLLDARPARDAIGSKAICQHRDVLDIWESVGAGAEIAAEGLTWGIARTFYQDSELFAIQLQDSGASPFPPFVNISQGRTEELLDRQIAAQPLIEVRWGHRVTSLEQDAREVRVGCVTDQGPVTLTGSFAVACPGARGQAVRDLLGVTFEGRTFGDQFLICDIRTDLPGWEHERRFYFDPAWNPGRQVLIHPCPDSTFRIDWQVPDGFDLAVEEAGGELDRRIRDVIGDRDYEIVWKSVYRFHARVANRMRVGRVLLAGDAAHLVAPFGARGLNSGVQDAENAAWKLAHVLNGWAPEQLLESYHLERHAAAVENLDVTANTMRFLIPQDEDDWRRRRDTLERARVDQAACAEVDSGRMAEPFWYVDSPLTTPDYRGPFPGRPPKGAVPAPAPGVLVPDVPVTVTGRPEVSRLRNLARSGVTVLVGDDALHVLADLEARAWARPVAVHAMSSLASNLGATLAARSQEVWVLRPDAHVAAVLDGSDAGAVWQAVDRALAVTATVLA
ncbi:FAD-dependent monooxygenase [Streptomyces sp. NBC_00258]|uniref:FAD-dependent monooxygenase n=1 Tax=Streptomyces sp. NBC_00258 TaxID=2903642 RepID=UPI002E2B901A|nr:FAD-dependent monooxygenase [Streptomyces sp. NBC_00258]